MRKRHNKVESAVNGRFLRVGRDRISITLDDRLLWMILIPVADNNGWVFLDGHHKRFDDLVLKISGGSTEHAWSSGKWIHESRLYRERMIPVVFLATTGQADKIAAFACIHYDQMKILYYPISERVRGCLRSEQVAGSSLATRQPKSRGRASVSRRAAAVSKGTDSVTSSREPSKARQLPPVGEAARLFSEGTSSPDSTHEEGE